MFLSWSIIVFAVALLAVQQCAGERSCVLMSSAGAVVHQGSSFVVYCTFNPTCKISRSMHMSIDGSMKSVKQTHKLFNETTISMRVENITEKRTYQCHSDCRLDPCGLDISAGCKLEDSVLLERFYFVVYFRRETSL
ncbi:hypothetical protein XENOCAPTIV_027199 [Xenoophorus captivus]|uniref:Immunoglobulin subtype domain-containing protein n=1 Tax=Xenoophorus captivus TaxID=1517983 RepID=A0ABV0RM29_9TELE